MLHHFLRVPVCLCSAFVQYIYAWKTWAVDFALRTRVCMDFSFVVFVLVEQAAHAAAANTVRARAQIEPVVLIERSARCICMHHIAVREIEMLLEFVPAHFYMSADYDVVDWNGTCAI